MTRRTYLIVTTLWSGSCRFLGPDDDPLAVLEVDAGRLVMDAASDARTPVGGTGDSQPPASDSAARDSAAGDPDAGGSDAGDSDAGGSDAGGSDAGDSGASDSGAAVEDAAVPTLDGTTDAQHEASVLDCDPPADLACDPVSGEGCLLFMQCLADPSSSEPAAYCVLASLQLLGTCEQGALWTDCPPRHTCVMGQCRQYCYCDADCDNGAACAEPSGEGSTRFRLCEQSSPP